LLGVIMVLVGAVLVSVFVLRLQPPYVPPSTLATTSAPTGPTVVMPSGVGSNNNLGFTPSTLTVVIGVNNTVTWLNRDQSIHTVTATDKSFDSGNILPGASFTYTFTTAGTYTYVCVYHSWMKGTVVVKESG
jgi:plastocyanin